MLFLHQKHCWVLTAVDKPQLPYDAHLQLHNRHTQRVNVRSDLFSSHVDLHILYKSYALGVGSVHVKLDFQHMWTSRAGLLAQI